MSGVHSGKPSTQVPVTVKPWFRSRGAAGYHGPWEAGEIAPYLRNREAGRRKQRRHGLGLADADLDREPSPGHEQARRVRRDRAVRGEAVRTSVERGARIVIA